MNLDLALVAAVLESRDLAEALKAGAHPSLLGDEAKLFWDVITEHYENHHEVPSVPYFQGLCPTYQHHTPSDGLSAIIAELQTYKLGSEIDDALHRTAEVNVGDPWAAKKFLVDAADRINLLNQRGRTDLVVGSDPDAIFKKLERLQTGQGLLGYPWPWDLFNNNSAGLCPGNLIYIYGRHKTRKTFLLLFLALFYEALGLRVLFFTREMTAEELEWRVIAIRGQFDYGRLLKGDVSPAGMQRIEQLLRDLRTRGKLIFTDVEGGLSGFKGKVEDVKPHIIIHDYWKAMADDAMSEKSNAREHVYVARTIDMLKAYLISKAKLPAIICGHANREGDKTRGRSSVEHAWSDHIARKVDLALRIICNKQQDLLALIPNAARGMNEEISLTISARLCDGFGQAVADNTSWVEEYNANETSAEQSKKRTGAAPAGDIPTKVDLSSFKPPRRPTGG